MKLYEIPTAFREVLDNIQIDEETGEVSGLEELKQFKDKVSKKVGDTGLYLLELKAEQEQINNEIDRLKKRLESSNRRAMALKNLIQDAFVATDTTKLKTPFITISLCKTHLTVIDDQSLLPEEFLKTKVETTPDKKAIAAKIKAGEEVKGAHLQDLHYLRIK